MTTTSPKQLLLGAFLLLLLIVPQATYAATHDLVLENGERFENVKLSVDRMYKVVKFEHEGKKRAASFADITAIYDAAGNDVTVDLLGGDYRPRPSTESAPAAPQAADTVVPEPNKDAWLTQGHETYRRANCRPWSMAVRVGGNLTVPIGTYYDDFSSGAGFGADLIVPLNSFLSLRGIVSMAGSNLDESDFFSNYSGFDVISNDIDVDIWRYLVAAQYQAPYHRNNFRSGYWYLFSGIGATSNSASGSALVRDEFSGDLYEFVIIPDKTRFTVTVGAGGVSMLSQWLGIEYGASFDSIYAGSDGDSGVGYGANGFNLDIRLSLVFHLPLNSENELN